MLCALSLDLWRCFLLLQCSTFWKTDDEVGGAMAGLGGEADAHPYVSFTINLVWMGARLSCQFRNLNLSIPLDNNNRGAGYLYIGIDSYILCLFTYNCCFEIFRERLSGGELYWDALSSQNFLLFWYWRLVVDFFFLFYLPMISVEHETDFLDVPLFYNYLKEIMQ